MEKNIINKHILFAAQLPPPHNGASIINKYVLSLVKQNFKSYDFVNMTGQGKKVSYIFSRIWKSAKLCMLLIRNSSRRNSTIYYMSISDGWGMLFEIIPWMLAGILTRKRIMHHHSFSYCYKKSLLMYLMQKIKKKSIINIVLCESHKQSFYSVYKNSTLKNNIKIVENDFVIEDFKAKDKTKTKEKLIIGHMSNLSIEKGLDKVIKIFDFFKSDNTIIFEIAGPVLNKDLKNLLNTYANNYPDSFYYRGSLYNETKANWYKTLDIFLFPSNYNAETYPLVILEAISYRIIPFTTPIGCLCEINNPLFISDYSSYYNDAINFIKKYMIDIKFRESCSSAISLLETELKNNIYKSEKLLLQLFEL